MVTAMGGQNQSYWQKQQFKLQRRAAAHVPWALPLREDNNQPSALDTLTQLVQNGSSSDACEGDDWGAGAKSRLVQCPRCRAILPEPSPGNPYFQCGGCATVLQAKHAVHISSFRPTRPHRTTSRGSSSPSSASFSERDSSSSVFRHSSQHSGAHSDVRGIERDSWSGSAPPELNARNLLFPSNDSKPESGSTILGKEENRGSDITRRCALTDDSLGRENGVWEDDREDARRGGDGNPSCILASDGEDGQHFREDSILNLELDAADARSPSASGATQEAKRLGILDGRDKGDPSGQAVQDLKQRTDGNSGGHLHAEELSLADEVVRHGMEMQISEKPRNEGKTELVAKNLWDSVGPSASGLTLGSAFGVEQSLAGAGVGRGERSLEVDESAAGGGADLGEGMLGNTAVEERSSVWNSIGGQPNSAEVVEDTIKEGTRRGSMRMYEDLSVPRELPGICDGPEMDTESMMSSHNSRQSLEDDAYTPAQVGEYVPPIPPPEFYTTEWAENIGQLLEEQMADSSLQSSLDDLRIAARSKGRFPSPDSVIARDLRPSPSEASPTSGQTPTDPSPEFVLTPTPAVMPRAPFPTPAHSPLVSPRPGSSSPLHHTFPAPNPSLPQMVTSAFSPSSHNPPPLPPSGPLPSTPQMDSPAPVPEMSVFEGGMASSESPLLGPEASETPPGLQSHHISEAQQQQVWQRPPPAVLEPPRRLFDRRRAAAIVSDANGDMETALALLTAEIEGRRLSPDRANPILLQHLQQHQHHPPHPVYNVGVPLPVHRPGIDRDRAAALLRDANGDMEAALALLTVEIESARGPADNQASSSPSMNPPPPIPPPHQRDKKHKKTRAEKETNQAERGKGQGGGGASDETQPAALLPWQKRLPSEESSPSPPQSPMLPLPQPRFSWLGGGGGGDHHQHQARPKSPGSSKPRHNRRRSALGRVKHDKKGGGGGGGQQPVAQQALSVPATVETMVAMPPARMPPLSQRRAQRTSSDSSFAEPDELPRLPAAAYDVPSGNDPLPRLPPPTAAQVVPCQHCPEVLKVPPPNSKASGSLGFEILRCHGCNMVSIFDRPAVPDLNTGGVSETDPSTTPLETRRANRAFSVPPHRATSFDTYAERHSVRRTRTPANPLSDRESSTRSERESARMRTHRRRLSDNFDPSMDFRRASWDSAGNIPRFAQTPDPSYIQRRRAAHGDPFRRSDGDIFGAVEEEFPVSPPLREAASDFLVVGGKAGGGSSQALATTSRAGRTETLWLSSSHGSIGNPFSMIGRSLRKMSERQKAIKEAKVYGRRVIVNGRKIKDVDVERAEKLAGPIHPGTYWYDSQAGFWGVIGGPCLGIIMPNIPEFSIPIARDCAAGDTQILVNGRELHKKDLSVLLRRGMPRTKGASYVLDITGHISDGQTGLRLKNLGRLAPSVEERGAGYGMYSPNDKDLRQSLDAMEREDNAMTRRMTGTSKR